MKNLSVFAAVALVCAACTNPTELAETSEASVETQRVTLSFSPYTLIPMGAKARGTTRATVPVSDVVNRLDVWLMEGKLTVLLYI